MRNDALGCRCDENNRRFRLLGVVVEGKSVIPLYRLWLACMGSLFVFVFVVGRLGYLQIYSHSSLSKRVERQHKQRLYTETPRGTIFDRSGHVLAMSIGGGSCFADPKRIQNPAAAARALSPVLNISVSTLQNKLSQRKRFVWLARRLDPERSQQLRSLGIKGISVVTESKRFYPEEALAAHVLGVVGGSHRGASGVEQAADEWLSGSSKAGTFASWELSEESSKFKPKGEATPRSVVLTIDRTLQYIVEQELAAQMELSRAKSGTVIVADPQTGEILAMATAPSFNPNQWGSQHSGLNHSVDELKNPAVEHVVEPGSTFKLITAAAALDQGVATPRDGFFCENGVWQIRGRKIHDHEKDGWLTLTEVVSRSSNIGTAKIALKLGPENLFRYARAFGFGMPTGCGLPGDGSGILRNPKVWTPSSLPTVAFGQEVGVTALQMVNAYCVVANGGVLLEPRLYKGVIDEKGEYHEWVTRKPIRRVISTQTVSEMRRILKSVVDNGTGKAAQVAGFSVGGKTGTAQKIDPATRQYSPDRYLASFCGFVPVESPQLVIGVFLDEPRTSQWGGQEAAPLFARIVRDAASYLQLKPQEMGPVALAQTVPNL
jgi:cell division protein FtsI (penicillin-binding protein 3)